MRRHAAAVRPVPGAPIRELLKPNAIEVVFQPIVAVANGALVAVEALACFPSRDDLPVSDVFHLAHSAGWGADLEAICLRTALSKRHEIPAGASLAVNLSPNALCHPLVQWALGGDLGGVIIEVTEQAGTDLDALSEALADIRSRGALVALDDVASGYSGLLRLTALRPDIVKLDRALVTGARHSEPNRAVIEALVRLSKRIGARTLGEGVETPDELVALAELDVDYAQGWATGRPAAVVPGTLPDAVWLSRGVRAAILRPPASGPAQLELSTLTAELAAATDLADVREVLAHAAPTLGVDAVTLHPLDEAERPAGITAAGASAEVHLNDVTSAAELRGDLAKDGFASLLRTPVLWRGTAFGVVELRHRRHRRWSASDIHAARDLANHLAAVLQRIGASTASTPNVP
jgi:EAL domain-containing protein (putative c-di-GMP-specific phosphodiesterase class I)